MKKLAILALCTTVATAPSFAETAVDYTTPNVELSTQQTDLSFAFDDVKNLQDTDMTLVEIQETEEARIPKFMKNIRIDGPDKGFKEHYNGKIIQIRVLFINYI